MQQETKLLPVIGVFKLIKATLLFLVAFGLHQLWRGDTSGMLTEWIRTIRVDPDDRIPHSIIAHATGMSPARLHHLGIGSFFYGTMFAIEGIGLVLKQRWAEYFTIATTATFLPLEIYELVAKPERKMIKLAVLLLNVIVLVYLIWNLRRTQKKDTSKLQQTATV